MCLGSLCAVKVKSCEKNFVLKLTESILVWFYFFSQTHCGDGHIWEPCAHQRSRDRLLHLYEQEREAHWQGKAVSWPQSAEREAKGWQPRCSWGQNVNGCSSTAREVQHLSHCWGRRCGGSTCSFNHYSQIFRPLKGPHVKFCYKHASFQC